MSDRSVIDFIEVCCAEMKMLTNDIGDQQRCVTGPGTGRKPTGSKVSPTVKKNTEQSLLCKTI